MHTIPTFSAKVLQYRYRRTLIVGGGLMLVAIVAYSWAAITSERTMLFANLNAQGERLQLSLNDKLNVAQSHVFAMRRSVERTMLQPEFADTALLGMLKQHSHAAPQCSPWDKLPHSLQEEIGSLHIDPKASLNQKSFSRDLSAVLSIMPEVVAAHEKHAIFQWSYYYNAQQLWFLVFPTLSQEDLLKFTKTNEISSALTAMFDAENTAPVTKAGPKNNPARSQIWTAPYLDFGGKGMMVSLLAPVYVRDRYIGTVGTDLTLEMLDTALESQPLSIGRSMVVDSSGLLLADSGHALKHAQANVRFTDIFPETAGLQIVNGKLIFSEHQRHASWLYYPLAGTTWTLLIYLPTGPINQHLLGVLRPYLAMAFILTIAMLWLAWVQNRQYAMPALQLAEYVDAVESNSHTNEPNVPLFWQYWFKKVAQSAKHRKELATATIEHADILERKVEELRISQELLMVALASIAETRDNETGNHILRTQQYVKLLAEHLRTRPRFNAFLNDETIDMLFKASPLHDIGKVGIPDQILLKPGKLTDEEFKIMKLHVTLGYTAIENAQKRVGVHIPLLEMAKEIAHSHHEKWDGSGYPNGLAGDAIPISARLMAVADVYDALSSPRVYRKSMPHDQVVYIIKQGRAQHFDPEIVDACLEIADRFIALAKQFSDESLNNS